MTFALSGLLAAALLQAPAAEAPQAAPEADPVEALKAEYEQAQQAFFEKFAEIEDDEERTRLYEEEYPQPEAFAPRFFEIADAHPKTDLAARALAWVASAVQDEAVKKKALDRLLEDHFDDDALAEVCRNLQYDSSETSLSFLRALLEKTPVREVQGHAAFALGRALLWGLRGGNDEQARKEAERLFERVKREFADLEGWRGTLGEAAEHNLFELRHLVVGRVAPDIEGEDVDGVAFRLSDYRGKVILLDFWGDW